MKKLFLIILLQFLIQTFSSANENLSSVDNLFHIDQMNSHNKNFALYFKGREKSILARGETNNYINDFPRDLYIYDYNTKISSPLIASLGNNTSSNLL